MRWQQFNSLYLLFLFVVVEPIFPGFEARHNGMPCFSCVLRRVLVRRAIATSDMAAHRTSPEVKPPSARDQTLHTPGTTRFCIRVNPISTVLHCFSCFAQAPPQVFRSTQLFLVIPTYVDKRGAHLSLQPNIYAGQPVNPTRLQFRDSFVGHFVEYDAKE